MSAPTRIELPARLHTLATMAGLLERLERQPAPSSPASAAQYRDVVRRVQDLLAAAEPDAELQALLGLAPHTAELYENMRYDIAGLCRAPLEAALNAELAATAAIARARGRG